MIIPLATKLREQVADFTRLRQSASQVDSIELTKSDLAAIRAKLEICTRMFLVLENCFSAEQNQLLRAELAVISRQLAESKRNYATEFNQHTALVRVQSRAQTLVDTMKGFWNQYAENRLRALRELARFARQLPRMQANLLAIESTFSQLEGLARKLPERATDVELFHSKLTQLSAALRNMEGMNPQQTAFLDKVGNGSATLADISPELLDWCRREELAPLLKISLGR
jgi:hypothetical protein